MLISKNIILFLAAPSAAGCKACLEQPRLKTMDTCLDVIFSLFLRKCCKNILACFLQWSDFRKKVGNPTKCPILVRIWWDFHVFGEIWRNLVEILRFIYMIMYF